ncbi:sensor histidine kinase [Chryseobacterium herbae]|uniref:histidine kinase n=1 Tax=Chryseobacterium herbae TaxID=2976476 RepID=A0ABT2IT19_9FLAO|nr:ATP-binding protein [Chryseobacterium sp. pc1-10]MCT2561973.1 ATP-binding protein [Chryseobacterium sp. pc1-10]
MPYRENQNLAVVLWIWIGIGLLFLITLFITVLTTTYLKSIKKNKRKVMQMVRNTQTECWENTLYIQEKDRERLAEELHDNIISRLNLIRLNTASKSVNELSQDIRVSMQLIRELSHNLTPPDLDDIELPDLIADYLEQVEDIPVAFHHSGNPGDRISSSVKLNMFRIVQELISNVLKHAQATKVEIRLRISTQYLILTVKDNGCGFKTGTQYGGIGLRNIRSRTQQINAVYKLKTKPEKGTQWMILTAFKSN